MGDEAQDARDALANAIGGKSRSAGNTEATDEPEIKLANPFEDEIQPTYTQGERDLDARTQEFNDKMKYGEEGSTRNVDPNAQPSQLSGEEISNPAFDPDQDLRPDVNPLTQPKTQLDAPQSSSLKTPTDNFDSPKINVTDEDVDPLTENLSGGLKSGLTNLAEKGGTELADEGIGLGSKLLSAGGMFLDALSPLGDLAMVGQLAYSAFTEKDEGAEMLNQGNKIHAQLEQMGQGASISEGSLAGASLDTMPQSVGATFPHF